jgi:hypothetical protein
MKQFNDWARDNAVTIESVFGGHKAKTKTKDNWKHFSWEVTLKVGDSDAWQVPQYSTGEGHREVFSEEHSMRAQRNVKEKIEAAEEQGATVHGLHALKQNIVVRTGPGVGRNTPSWVVPNPPTLGDVLQALQSDAQIGEHMLFEDFCSDLGYDVDSREAEKTWRACQETRGHLQRLFGSLFDSFTELQEE